MGRTRVRRSVVVIAVAFMLLLGVAALAMFSIQLHSALPAARQDTDALAGGRLASPPADFSRIAQAGGASSPAAQESAVPYGGSEPRSARRRSQPPRPAGSAAPRCPGPRPTLVTQDWVESTITWNNRPATGEPLESTPVDAGSGYKHLDVTRIVRAWHNVPHYGLALWVPRAKHSTVVCSKAARLARCRRACS